MQLLGGLTVENFLKLLKMQTCLLWPWMKSESGFVISGCSSSYYVIAAESLREEDGTCAGALGRTLTASAELAFDGTHADAEDGIEATGIVVQEIADAFGEACDPLTVRHARQNVLRKMHGGLDHVLLATTWAQTATFA